MQLLEKLIDEHEFSECCWARLSEMKDIMYCAYDQYRENAASKASSPVQERILWALQALRANDFKDIKLFISALGSASELKHSSFSGVVPITEEHIASIRRMLREALAIDDAGRMEKLQQADQMQDYEKQKTKEILTKKLALHNPKRRKQGIEAVRGENGEPISEKTLADDFLGKYWGDKFKEKRIEEEETKRFTRNCPKRFTCLQWVLSFITFASIVTDCKKSPPGPDGIPYRAWASSLRAQIILYSAYVNWICTGYCPKMFNIALVWLLPKSDPHDGIFNATDTRPLTGANADAKMFAMMLASCFNTKLDYWPNVLQRGFIRGRSLIQNVIDVETHAIASAYIKEALQRLSSLTLLPHSLLLPGSSSGLL